VSAADLAAMLSVGIAAGTINTVVGSGTLITFPVLLALGYAPLVANVTNTVGLVPGGASGVVGYRRELQGQGRRVAILGAIAAAGGCVGAELLLRLPASVFSRAVPGLILVACVLVIVQPLIRKALASRKVGVSTNGGLGMRVGAFLTAIYGGYFGAGQGVVLMSLLGISLHDDLQRLNAAKNVLAMAANAAAGIVFCVAGPVSWPAAAALATGSLVGGHFGAHVGRRLAPSVLRMIIVVIGVAAAIRLLV